MAQKTTTAKSADNVALSSAPPPLHSVMLVGALIALFTKLLPSWKELREAATVDLFTKVVFPEYLDLVTVGYIRLLIATSIWLTCIATIFGRGWEQRTSYLEGSKLKMVPNRLRGLKTMFPFTSWSFLMLGASFSLNAYVALATAADKTLQPWVLPAAMVCWEIAAPFTLLVAAVVRYAIWPGVLKKVGDTTQLRHPRNWMMHNMNAFFALAELALLGGIPVRSVDIPLAGLFGCLYILFTWSMTTSWNEPVHGPQFIYFFMDTTLPGYKTSIALIVLLFVLMVFYAVFVFAEAFLLLLGGSLPMHLAFVAGLCSVVMRFRDY